jgi:hypothetical protein
MIAYNKKNIFTESLRAYKLFAAEMEAQQALRLELLLPFMK